MVGPTTIVDDNQAGTWIPYNPPDQTLLVDDPLEKKTGTDSLRIDVLKPGRALFSLAHLDFPRFQDWGGKKYLSFWYKGMGSDLPVGLKIAFGHDKRNYATYNFPDSSEWRNVILSLDSPSSKVGEPDWSQVSEVNLNTDTKDLVGPTYLDGFAVWDEAVSDEPEEPLSWIYLEQPLDLNSGKNAISLEPSGALWVDMVALYSRDEGGVSPEELLSYRAEDQRVRYYYDKIEPTLYEVRVRAEEPFLLHFSEGYHPQWKAFLDGQELEHVAVNSFVNGYFVDRVGDYSIRIEYVGQRYASLGSKISGASWLLAAAYLAYRGVRRWKAKR